MEKRARVEKSELDKFGEHILKGLSGKEKKISSKYLYNAEGSRLFEEIMNLPEYYPTRCELEILQNYKKEILHHVQSGSEIYLVDLGAGNGLKTMVLLNYFVGRAHFRYIPVDISKSALSELEASVRSRYKDLVTEPIHGEYMDALGMLKPREEARKLILFLGSTIGNFTFREALHFLTSLHKVLNEDDLLLIGFDRQKDPDIIRTAYNDSQGITAKFNINILHRINEELGGNFNPENFLFYPTYDPVTGEMKSFLVSRKAQEVYIEKLDKTFRFGEWEPVHTECSNKYNLETIRQMARLSGFVIEENFFDSKNYFIDSLWKAV